MLRVAADIAARAGGALESRDELSGLSPDRFGLMVAGNDEAILSIPDQLCVGADRAGQDDASRAHGFRNHHAEGLEACLKTQRVG